MSHFFSNNKFLKITSIVIFAVIISGLCGYLLFVNEVKNLQENLKNEIDISDNWSDYKNNKLGVSFLFPSELGVIKEVLEDKKNNVALSVENDIFMVASNGKYGSVRDAYWGDTLKKVDSIEYLMDYCQNKKDCNIKENKNKVTYTKEVINEFSDLWGISLHRAVFYYLYNPNSEYKGIVISTDKFADKNINNLEEVFDKIVESVKFIK